MERRINRGNQFANNSKGVTALSLLEKKKQREEARKQTREEHTINYADNI